MTRLVNCTPHPFVLRDYTGNEVFTLEKSENPVRVSTNQSVTGSINVTGLIGDVEVEIYETTFGDVENLPAPEEGTLYIVSRIVAAACPGRDDLVIPNDLVRDENGNIIGCRSLARP